MNQAVSSPNRSVHGLLALASALVLVAGAVIWTGASPAYALPEYADRTGESCATCHVNPGGGGPRTMRGMLWGARGRPDLVPTLPGLLIAPGVEEGAQLYEMACAPCHGRQGEGLFAMGLADSGVSEGNIRAFTLRGLPRIGMPAFEGQFTDSQLESLVTYVTAMAQGRGTTPTAYSLPPARLRCDSQSPTEVCPRTRRFPVRGNN